MSLFNFLHRKAAQSDARPEPAYTFGGGDGLTYATAVKIIPGHLAGLRQAFKSIIGNRLPPEMETPSALDAMIAEMCKMAWLETKFGNANKAHWKCGDRTYLHNARQSQVISFRDGRSVTIFFDFSEFHPDGW